MNKGKHLKAGNDPRALPDYVALRDEVMKLSHPARPDVDWKYAQTLCLRLFEHNGVELQTAAWYTLVRVHIAGLTGMHEGLTLINALTAYQWPVMWPTNIHARVEILTRLGQRLHNVFRTLALNDHNDLHMLYQTEKSLTALTQILARYELKQASQLDILLLQVRQVITRLENTPRSGSHEPVVVLPPQVVRTLAAEKNSDPERLVFLVHTEPGVDVSIAPPSIWRGSFRAFIAGIFCTVVVGGLLLWGWSHLNASSPAEQQLLASLVPLPDRLSTEQLTILRQSVTEPQFGKLAERTRKQLKWLMSLPPDWPQQYGQMLITQAQMLWPENSTVVGMQKDWQQQIEVNALPRTALNSWHDGMVRLQQLTDKLNGLDEKRGKYLTVSELKSAVFAITQALNKHPPAEELLRQYSVGVPEIQQRQAEMALEQLQNRAHLSFCVNAFPHK